MKNLQFFGAPHVALLFMAPVYETVRVAGDVGMFGQSLLLSLEAHGLGGVPQTLLSFFAGAAREVLGIDPMYKMLFGISFVYPEPGNPVNNYQLDKAPIEEQVTFNNSQNAISGTIRRRPAVPAAPVAAQIVRR